MAKRLKKLILNGESYDLGITPSTATSSTAGVVKLGSDTAQSTAANAVTSTASRTYAIQTNSSGQMVVNVPWEDSQTSGASSTTAGTLKLGSDTVQTVSANTPTATASRSYALQLNASGQGVVNVPWENTTYGEVSKSDMDTGTATTPGVVAAKSIADYVKGKISNTYVYKGSKATYGDLPATGNVVGDVWNVVAAYSTYPAGTNFAWDGEDWDALGGTVDLSNYVDKSSAQTISGVKTFSSEPVLPSKTTGATNSGTKPATEAQVYTVAQAIPTVNNATLTIKQNSTSKGTFTANASSNVEINLTDTTYESKTAASGGTAVSLVTTGEKYTWNNKASSSDIGNATITFKQGIDSTAIGTLTTNQSSAGTITMHDNVTITQSDYDNLPSTKGTDGNAYWIYETVS